MLGGFLSPTMDKPPGDGGGGGGGGEGGGGGKGNGEMLMKGFSEESAQAKRASSCDTATVDPK